MKTFFVKLGMMILAYSIVFGALVFAEESKVNVLPEIYIKAVNPGYTVDGVSNVGEIIELARRDDDLEAEQMISLAGVTVRYTTSSGNKTTIVEFPENSYLAGESILLRLASSPDSELAAMDYTKTLAYEGAIEILKNDEVVDAVCWTGKEGCKPKFKTGSMTTLIRNLETLDFDLVNDYVPHYEAKSYVVIEEDGKGEVQERQCNGVMLAEVLSYYEETQAEQFIEIYNNGAEQVLLDGCTVRYKNKNYPLEGVLKAGEYFVRYLVDFSIAKNPTNVGKIDIIDVDGSVAHTLEYPNGQRKGTSWAFLGYDESGKELWRTTYRATPGEPNVYQEFKTCEAGKIINEVTGNCVKVTEITEKICAEGQYLNILTGRCRKIEEKTTTECKEGYEMNPETGRCKKIKENNGANYALATETYEEKSAFVAVYLIIGVVAVGVVYVVYEFRVEIGKIWRKIRKK